MHDRTPLSMAESWWESDPFAAGYFAHHAGKHDDSAVEARENGDRVFVWVRFTGTPADTAIPLTLEMAHVITLEEGKVRCLEEYLDRGEAIEAVGLKG